MGDQIKKFITCHIPLSLCNFKCHYCYVCKIEKPTIENFCMEPREIVKKLSKKQMGGGCYFNLCADGETMLHPQLVELVYELTKEGHFVDIISNGTIEKKVDELISLLDIIQQKHLFIKFSFHYLELLRTGLMEKFIKNINKIKDSDISYSIEITPNDELIDYIDEIKNFSLNTFGAYPHITVARNENTKKIEILSKYNREDYKKIWGQFNSAMFDFKFSTFNVKRHEFCYAGDWSLKINLGTGDYIKCYGCDPIGNIMENGDIKFCAIGKCPLPHCYNGHAFLALGNIPGLQDAPTYAEERDRVMIDGKHWLKNECREFFSTKLYDSNRIYSDKEKKECLRITKVDTFFTKLKRLKNKLS